MSLERYLPDREALDRFKEHHPELDSVRQIVKLDEADFVARYAAEFDDGERQARRVFQTARDVNEKMAIAWANIADLSSPHLWQTRFNNVPKAFLDYLEKIPGYDQIFGGLDFIECDHCRSIFGPAAYFVDLMRFVETYIVEGGGNSIPTEMSLGYRRPDLERITLDCHNAHDLIPYIDLVNEILEGIVQSSEGQNAYQLLASTVFPMDLPFNRPLAEIRAYLKQLKTSLHEIYDRFAASPEASLQVVSREFLEMSPETFNLLAEECSRPADLSRSYGLDVTLSGVDGLENLAVFRAQTGLDRQQVNELLYQDLDQHEVNAGLHKLFFINDVDDGLGPITLVQSQSVSGEPYEKLTDLSFAKLDRIFRFVKLARHLGWPFAELDWALRSLREAYQPERALNFDGRNDYVAISAVRGLNLSNFTIEAWVSPKRRLHSPIIARGTGGAQPAEFMLSINENGKLVFYNEDQSHSGNRTLPLDHFSHVAAVYDGHELRFYVNGQLDLVTAERITLKNKGDDLNIGRDLYDRYFQGIIKDVRIWDVGRSPVQIAANRYSRLTGLEKHLLAYWPLTENRWNRLADRGPGGHDGHMGGEQFVTQPTWVQRDLVLQPFPERISGGYLFDGQDDHLAARDVDGLDVSTFTVEVWLTAESLRSSMLLIKGDEDSDQTHFYLGLNRAGELVFKSDGVSALRSSSNITPGKPTHVCLVVSPEEVKFYIDGELDSRHQPRSLRVMAEPGKPARDLIVGRSYTGNYFAGLLQELRIWAYERSQDQILSNMHRRVAAAEPGLAGYWRLGAIDIDPVHRDVIEVAQDLTYNQNHLYLGGVPEDYWPDRVGADHLSPPSPVATDGTVLQFDGDNDVVVITNPKQAGLGAYERWTVSFWFRADEPQLPWEQLLFAQGDGEAGLSVFLRDGDVHVATWNADYELSSVDKKLFSAGPIQAGQWHHLAISSNESKSLNSFDVIVTLDGQSVDQGQGYRLSPVGPIYLGGLARGAITYLDERYTGEDEQHRYFFSGQISHFQLWKEALDAAVIHRERWLAPEKPDESLLAYLPIDEGRGYQVLDRDEQPDHHGQLQINEMALVTSSVSAEGEQLFSHYNEPAAWGWQNYFYGGRVFLADGEQAIGVTILSRHHENVDHCYLLRRTPAEPSFKLLAHPAGIQEVAGLLDSGVVPRSNTWYRFLIRVDIAGEKTAISAKIWVDEEPEPADYQIQAVDESHIHIKAGTVGIWSEAGGTRWVDDLRVWPATIEKPDRAALILGENFEAYSAGSDPDGWLDSRVHYVIEEDDALFRTAEVAGEIALTISGDHSELQDVHCHYNQPEALAWNKYVYRGRLRISEANQAIGLTFFSQFPARDAYYRLRRYQEKPAFHLDAHPYQIHDLSGQLETDLGPEPDHWYHFYIEVEDGEAQTDIRAKVWPQGEDEPAAFQIEAHDAGENRLRSGTVGLWTLGPGERYFADLQVAKTRLLADNFARYAPGDRPEPWSATRMTPARQVAEDLFQVTAVGQEIAFGLDGRPQEMASLHSYYADGRALEWRDYAYSGRFFLGDGDAAMGLTFLGQMAGGGVRHYRLGRTARRPNLHLTSEPYGYPALELSVDDAPVLEAKKWYRFRIEVRDQQDVGQTEIGVKICVEGEDEPADFQIQAHDSGQGRLVAGTVGLWGIGGGAGGNAFYVDDLLVTQLDGPQTLFNDTFSKRKASWKDVHFVPEDVPPEVHVERYKKTTFKALGNSFLSEAVIQPWGAVKRFDPEMSHYHGAFHDDKATLEWSNYAVRGRIHYSEKDSGVGFIFFSRRPAGELQEYRLTRDEPHTRFRLTSTGDPLSGRTEADFETNQGTWYSVLIEVRDTGNRTHIRAKIWDPETESEPQAFQLEAEDASEGRLRAGTIGVWTNGPGSKQFADLQVERLALLNDDFERYGAGSTPENWEHARSRPELVEANDRLSIASVDGNQALQLSGAGGAAEQYLTHLTDPASLAWTNYEYSGRLRFHDAQEAVGITFFSRYLEGEDHYYTLRRDRLRPNWHLTGHPFQARLLSGQVELDELPAPDTWYRFRVGVVDRGEHTEIQAKIWPGDRPEPADYQLKAMDDSPDRLTAGAVGLWTQNEGQVLFDDLQVYHDVQMTEVFAAYGAGADPGNWLDTRTQSVHLPDDTLFKVQDARNNLARWRQSTTYPVLMRPLDSRALAFDGHREYMAAAMQGLEELERFSIEVWLLLLGDGTARQPVLRLTGRRGPDRPFDLALVIEPGEKVNLLSGNQSLGISDDSSAAFLSEGWNQLSLVVGPSEISTFINGMETLKVANAAADAGLFHIEGLEIGRLGVDRLHGQVRDIRLWRGSREGQLADDILYQLPVATETLLGYWPLTGDSGVWALDESGSNHLRLGGLIGARQPEFRPGNERATHWPYSSLDTSLSFESPGDGLHLDWGEQGAGGPLQRRTAEIWFSVADKEMDQGKQILYHEGDDQRGLVIYIQNGQLCFGGYNDPVEDGAAEETTWPGTWLCSDRFESGKWHQATLVLDGRKEMRPGSLRAYLDGRLVGLGDGCQLGRAPSAFSLGEARRAVRFEDGTVEPGGDSPTLFAGELLDVRLWHTARSQDDIWANRAKQLSGREKKLALWLQADENSLAGAASSWPGLKEQLDDLKARLKPLTELTNPGLPGSFLAQETLVQIAHIKRLKEQYRLSMDRLCALWYEVKHTGRADQQTLFDQLFNPDGVVQERWPVYPDVPLRWDVSGQREPQKADKAIRSRLMAALRLSHDDLNHLVAWLYGSQAMLTLDKSTINELYRLASLAGLMRQGVPDLLKLLGMMGIGKADLSKLETLVALEERAAWMKRSGLTAAELDLLLNDEQSKRAKITLDQAALQNLVDEIGRQAPDFLVTSSSFQSDDLDQVLSVELFQFLVSNGFVRLLAGRQDAGLATAKYPHADFEKLASELGWASRMREALGAAVLHDLRYSRENGVVEQRPGMDFSVEGAEQLRTRLGEALAGTLTSLDILNPHGYLTLSDEAGPSAEQRATLLAGLKAAGPDVASLFSEMEALPLTMATAIWDVLKRWQDSQNGVGQSLSTLQTNQRVSLLDGLSDLTGADAEVLQAIVDYFAASVSAGQLLEWLLALAAGDDSQSAALSTYLYKVGKTLYLVEQFGLTALETAALLAHPERFGVDQVLTPTIEELEHLHTYTELRQALDDGEGGLLALINLDGSDEMALQEAMIDLADCEPGQLQALLDHFSISGAYNRPAILSRLWHCFELASSMGVDIPFLVQLATHNGQESPDYAYHQEQAALLLSVLRSQYREDRWPKIYRPLHDALAVRQRDALLNLVMLDVAANYQGEPRADILSEYFLIDVQTGSEVDTSRLVQAIASLQLYVQRCQMNLEKGIDPASIPADEWEWVKNYRVWEANRKVFLYPENYIEPELRDSKSPFFEELEQELMQGEVNQAAVEKAYINYLDKFARVGNLKIVGSYLHTDDTDSPVLERDETLYLVGQRRDEPRVHYYRERERTGGATTWKPWKKIELTINGDFVTPVYAFNKLFLFWVELNKSTKSVEVKDAAGETKHENVDIYRPVIKYTYFNFSRNWVQPLTMMVKDQEGKEIELDETMAVLDSWQRVVVQRAVKDKLVAAPQHSEEEKNALVLQLDSGTSIKKLVANLNTGSLTWSFWTRFFDPDPRQSVEPITPQTHTLFTYGQRLEVKATSNVTAIPGAQEAYEAAVAAYDAAAREHQRAASALQRARDVLRSDPQNTDKQKAVTDAEAAVRAAQAAEQAAKKKKEEEEAKPKWETLNVKVRFQIDQQSLAERDLNYDAWHHLALTLSHDGSGYAPVLYLDGSPVVTGASRAAALLPGDGQLTFSPISGSAFKIQMSEFRLWAYARSQERISIERDERKLGSEIGLSYMPLNGLEPGATMTLVASALTFRTPSPETIPVVRDERLVIFYGNIAASIRNDLQEQSFDLRLKSNYKKLNYDVTLTMTNLHMVQREGLSINDYVESSLLTGTAGGESIKLNLRSLSPTQIREYIARWQVADAQIAARNQVRFILRTFFGFQLPDEPLQYSDMIRAAQAYLDELYKKFNRDNYLFKELPAFESAVMDVGNQPGWYIVDTGNEQFLMTATIEDVQTVSERMLLEPGKRIDEFKPQPVDVSFAAEQTRALEGDKDVNPPFAFKLERLSTYAVYELSRELFKNGLEAMLGPDLQQAAEWDFDLYKHNGRLIQRPATGAVDFDGAHGLYYREIFFHIPFYVANLLNANQRFDEAQKWYHTVFDPMSRDGGNGPGRYWRYLPFREPFASGAKESLWNILVGDKNDQAEQERLERALRAYRQDPFDPHAIAELRLFAYQKAIVMKYIDNLLDWGDYLFSQDTRESINEAIGYYLLAYNLLGPRPEGKVVKDFREIGDYAAVRQSHDALPDFLITLEESLTGTAGSAVPTPYSHIATEFCVGENAHFVGYWDRVEDRLYKIRHSLSIEGVFRQLALFEPPIEPGALVRAVAGGLGVSGALASAGVAVPHYRYSFMLERAQEMTSRVIELGGALLSALESKDAEALALLQNTQERDILTRTTEVLKLERDAAEEAIKALQVTKRSIEKRKERYTMLADENLSPEEILELVLLTASYVANEIAVGFDLAAAAANAVPNFIVGGAGAFSSPVALTMHGGSKVADTLKDHAESTKDFVRGFDFAAKMTDKANTYKRRKAEWEFEKALAEFDLEGINHQISQAELARQIADKQIAIQARELEHNQQVADFYRSKFSNQALYSWMVSRLSALYFQTFKLAYDLAKAAEKAVQYELPTTENFIGFGHWDSLKKGLLAGESLMLDLGRMQKVQLEQDSRFLEIEKTISMRRTFPGALFLLATTGECEFELGEALFDLDFPGHYCRLIKTISISVRADVDPFDGVKATLVQLSNKTLLEPNIDAVQYLLGNEMGGELDTSVIRANWRANQQIAISRQDEDSGMFALDFFFDDRYFPFEGTGAVSHWRLEMPRESNSFDFDRAKDDVLIHLRYTAKTAPGPFKKEVMDLLSNLQGQE